MTRRTALRYVFQKEQLELASHIRMNTTSLGYQP